MSRRLKSRWLGWESYVKANVRTGDCNNASEVIREALRVLQEREADRKVELEALMRLIRDGEESGAPVPWNPDAIEEEARKRVRKRR